MSWPQTPHRVDAAPPDVEVAGSDLTYSPGEPVRDLTLATDLHLPHHRVRPDAQQKTGHGLQQRRPQIALQPGLRLLRFNPFPGVRESLQILGFRRWIATTGRTTRSAITTVVSATRDGSGRRRARPFDIRRRPSPGFLSDNCRRDRRRCRSRRLRCRARTDPREQPARASSEPQCRQLLHGPVARSRPAVVTLVPPATGSVSSADALCSPLARRCEPARTATGSCPCDGRVPLVGTRPSERQRTRSR